MKNTHSSSPPKQPMASQAHFAWCTLVGLRLAQQEGQALSPLTSRVVGDVLDSWELGFEIREQHTRWCLLSLLPSAETSGEVKVPEDPRATIT